MAQLSMHCGAMRDTFQTLVGGLEIVMAVTGIVLLWRLVVSPTARALRPPPRIDTWETPISEFLMFLLYMISGFFLAAVAAGGLAKLLPFRGDELKVFNGAFVQLGMLAGVVAYWFVHPRSRPQRPAERTNVLLSGGATFLIALPVLIATASAWEAFLRISKLPVERQDLIRILSTTDSGWLVATMMLLAIVIAPVTEELIFRGGIFRYLRTRVPHAVALVAPAVFFALLHVDWKTMSGFASIGPLIVLAVIFSMAYERTGHIATPIVAHALFNLNSIVLTLSGLSVAGSP